MHTYNLSRWRENRDKNSIKWESIPLLPSNPKKPKKYIIYLLIFTPHLLPPSSI